MQCASTPYTQSTDIHNYKKHTQTCTYTYIHAYIHTYIHTYIHSYIQVPSYTRTQRHGRLKHQWRDNGYAAHHNSLCMFVRMYVCMYVCMYVRLCANVRAWRRGGGESQHELCYILHNVTLSPKSAMLCLLICLCVVVVYLCPVCVCVCVCVCVRARVCRNL